MTGFPKGCTFRMLPERDKNAGKGLLVLKAFPGLFLLAL